MKRKVGILIARFQIAELHDGHEYLLEEVLKISDKVILFLGTTSVKGSNKDPLDFQTRKFMVESYHYLNLEIHPLPDIKSDDVWSKKLDNTINELTDSNSEITLYGSRGCFSSHYSGNYPVHLIEPKNHELNATDIRNEIGKIPLNSEDFRKGVIYSTQNTYDKFYQTVDVAILDDHNRILLGRKPNETLFRFPGGFTDPNFDDSLERAAKREAMEECGNCEFADFIYVTSMKVNDWRYKGINDSIMTALFKCKYIYGPIKASDDLEEVKWFPLDTLVSEDIVSEHRILLERLMKTL